MLKLYAVALIIMSSCFAGTEDPTPKATLTGHQSMVTCVLVSAELGIVVSGSLGEFKVINSAETGKPLAYIKQGWD